MTFEGAKKKLVLNRTNGECLKALFGRNVDDWIGKRITLYVAEFNGEPCIRIKGSPDIERPITFELKLPRKKPRPMTMQKTGGNGTNGTAKSAPVPQNVVDAAEALGGEIGGPETDNADIQF